MKLHVFLIITDKSTQENNQGHVNDSFTDNEVKIPLNELWDYVNSAYKNDCKDLHNEFQVILH